MVCTVLRGTLEGLTSSASFRARMWFVGDSAEEVLPKMFLKEFKVTGKLRSQVQVLVNI